MNLNDNWRDATIIAFDTETTGKYPLTSELCEVAAVKWRAGKIIDKFQSLIKPTAPMGNEVIAIHNITNEMVADAPAAKPVVESFHKFIDDGFLLAHHAPFDLGFITIEFEKYNLELPKEPVLCSSLISRRALPESKNHKLQTLIEYLNLAKGSAHRALDDAEACLQVGLKCFEKIGSDKTVADLVEYQQAAIKWADYSMQQLAEDKKLQALVEASQNKSQVYMVYEGGSKPGQERIVRPVGIVRNPNGDFLVAFDGDTEHPKRYFLKKVSASRRL